MRCLVALSTLALALVRPGTARAGERTTSIGLVNLDDSPKSGRFDKLNRGFDSAIRSGASSVIGRVEVVSRAAVAPFLRPGCTLAMPSEDWAKLEEKVRGGNDDRFLDYLVLYCSTGPSPTITLAVYSAQSRKPFMVVTLEPKSGSVGKATLASLARAILEFSSLRFSP